MTLDLTSAKFSLANARELALYARMAYDETPTIDDAPTDTRVLIRDLGYCIVVSFCGTRSLRNFITDADCREKKMPLGLGWAHHGFMTAALAIWARLQSQLTLLSALANNKPVFFVGHSLGGALAMICAHASRLKLFNIHSVYTFGCPRSMDGIFQRAYNVLPVPRSPFATLGDATFTVINDCDIVARVPGWLAGFRRPGRDGFISALSPTVIVQDPKFTYRLESDFWSLLDSIRSRRDPLVLDQLLTDHHVNCYITALEKIESVAL